MRRCQIDIFPFNCHDGFHPIFNQIRGENPEGIQVELEPIIKEIHQCDVARLTRLLHSMTISREMIQSEPQKSRKNPH